MRTWYRIQERKMSSNIIEYSTDNKNWHPLLGPFIIKKVGDALSDIIMEYLVHDAVGIDIEEEMLFDIDNTKE